MMSIRRAVCLVALPLFALPSRADLSLPSADPQLNARGRSILSYFQELQASPELRLVSGQFCGWSGTGSLDGAAKIHRATGQWPAVVGLDYCRFEKNEATIDVRPPNELAMNYWRDGGLVTISWHAPNPGKPQGGGLKERGVKLADLLLAGTPAHERWFKSLDAVAAGLQELQAAGVVVIWRPLHEMNGGWFWWGAQEPADYIAVWRQMFDYFTRDKKLHNLIWAFGPNHGQRRAVSYYPGDRYVDLTGLDAYTDHVDPAHIAGYPELSALNKPFGFTEFGPHGADHPPGDFDFRRFLAGTAEHFPRSRHFLVWDAKWNPAENKFAREFYNDLRVITRARLPAGLAGAAAPAAAAGADYAKSIETWRRERVSRLTTPNGWLSLIGRHLLAPGINTVGTAADNSIHLAAGPPYLGTVELKEGKVTLTPAPKALLQIDGQPAGATVALVYHGDKPSTVTFGSANFYVMERGESLFLRVKDSTSERLRNFVGLDYFPLDPTWRIEADWVKFDPPRQVNITNMIGQTSPAPVPGKAVFTREGHTFELLPIDEGGDELFFVITDLTAGEETYAACRFVYAAAPKDGKVILDFNRAQNPPCAFTPFATCPLPPTENRMPIRVPAGEKNYRGHHD